MSEIVSTQFLCQRYEVVRSTISDWVKKQPSLRVSQGKFNLAQFDLYVIKTLKDEIKQFKEKQENVKGNRLFIAQCRKIEAEATLKEIEIDKQKSLLISLEEVESDISNCFGNARTKLMALPSRVALELSGITDPAIIEERLDAVIREALEELASEFDRENEAHSNSSE